MGESVLPISYQIGQGRHGIVGELVQQWFYWVFEFVVVLV